MMNKLDSYYILGIKPGASPVEIKSAFRRLTRLYHPDHDSSLDAEMKYKEIRAAYNALKNLPEASSYTNTGAADARHYGNTTHRNETVCGKNWSYTEDDDEGYESQHFDFSDLMQDYSKQGKERPKKRLPFSLGNLHDILNTSFEEVFSIGMAGRTLFAMWGIWATLTMAGWSWVLSFAVVLCILPGALICRYHPAHHAHYQGTLSIPNAAAILTSFALSFLDTLTASRISIELRGWGIHIYGSGPVFWFLAALLYMWLFLLWGRNDRVIIFFAAFSSIWLSLLLF